MAEQPDLTLAQFATKPRLRAELTDEDGGPLDLDGADVTMVMAPWKGGPVVAQGSAQVIQEDESVTLVEYAWLGSGDTRMPGLHNASFYVGDAQEGVPTDNMLIEIIPRVGS